jgi:hypothetical protein
MKLNNLIDPVLIFNNLKTNERIILAKFNSPDSETSVLKDVPIDCLKQVKDILKKVSFYKFRIVYRGPRYDSMACYCLKKDAKRFAVYGA